jgi:hypothetical protein
MELIGRNPSEMKIVKTSTLSKQSLESLMETGRAFFETDMIRRDGTQVHVEVNSALIRYGAEDAALSVVRDMSVARHLQSSRRRNSARNGGYSIRSPRPLLLNRGPLGQEQPHLPDPVGGVHPRTSPWRTSRGCAASAPGGGLQGALSGDRWANEIVFNPSATRSSYFDKAAVSEGDLCRFSPDNQVQLSP